MALLDDEAAQRVNVFDWQAEFPQVFADGGFDVIVGNPPYIRIQALKEWAPLEVEYYKRRYRAASKGNYDIYVVFVEKGLSLLNERGRLGYILPHKFFNAKYGEPLRGLIAEGQHLAKVVHFGDQQVFAGATTYTCLLFLEKQGRKSFNFVKADDLETWRLGDEQIEGEIAADIISEAEWNFVVGSGADLFARLQDMPVRLGDVATRLYQGPITSADTVFLFKDFQWSGEDGYAVVFSKEAGEWTKVESEILKKVVRSGDIDRHRANATALVLFPYEVKENQARLYSQTEMREQFPLAWAYLNKYRRLLEGREKGKFKDDQWYRFGRTQESRAMGTAQIDGSVHDDEPCHLSRSDRTLLFHQRNHWRIWHCK